MSYGHIYTPAALADYTEALIWYKLRSQRAAENFVREVNTKIAEICKSPFRFRNSYKNFREVSVKRYPFYIIYFVDEVKQLVIISAVYHHKRNPGKKFTR